MPGIQKLHLEDAFEDSPQTRNLLKIFENDALMLRNYIVTLHRCFNRVLSAQRELCTATQLLSVHLKSFDEQHFPLESDESILSSTLGQFAIFLDELSSVQQVLLSQFNDGTMFPINKFLQSDLDEILTMKEVFQSASNEHERSLANYMKYPKKKEQEKAKQETVDELYVSRKKLHQTALHYYSSLNGLQYKRKSHLLDPLIGLMNAQKTFFEIGKEAVLRKDVEEFVSNINASVQGVQDELKVASQNMSEEIETIEEQSIHKYYAEPLPDMPLTSPNYMLSQKAGYLFLRVKLTLLSTRWDRCYFFIQGGNLMCQAKEEVAGSPILDLNTPVKYEAIECEDRRFVFQIVQPSSKKTVILQAENAFERDEWIATIGNASKDGSTFDENKVMLHYETTSDASSVGATVIMSSVPITIPKEVSGILTDSSSAHHPPPPTPPSTPSDGAASFVPDAPIQFDIITPAFDGTTLKNVSQLGIDVHSKRINPFNKSSSSSSAVAAEANVDSYQAIYTVRFLGSQQVKTDRGEPIVRETVRQIMASRAIYNIFKMTEFHMAVSDDSIRLLDPLSGNITVEFSLKDVSYWAVHNENNRLFGFIIRLRDSSISDESTFTCYVFECNTSGEEICHAIASATQIAFQLFMQKEAVKMDAVKEKELLLANIEQLEDQKNQPKFSQDGQFLILDESGNDGLSSVRTGEEEEGGGGGGTIAAAAATDESKLESMKSKESHESTA